MEIIFIGLSVLQNIAISLGVGSSTIAVSNFFVAIADGKIDATERKMMGVTYVALRVAMVVILVTTLAILLFQTQYLTGIVPTMFVLYQLVLVSMLFLNSYLMTKKIMPSTFGPAIQAGSWYTLGIFVALEPFSLTNFTILQFILIYASIVLLGITLVNGMMAYLKARKNKIITTT